MVHEKGPRMFINATERNWSERTKVIEMTKAPKPGDKELCKMRLKTRRARFCNKTGTYKVNILGRVQYLCGRHYRYFNEASIITSIMTQFMDYSRKGFIKEEKKDEKRRSSN